MSEPTLQDLSQGSQKSEKSRHLGRDLFEIVKVFLVSLAIVLPIRYFIVQPFIVRGASMEPSFENKEYLIIDEFSYYLRTPERGEAIVFRYPKDPRQFFIKRIIGLPGEEIKIEEGGIYIYNEENSKGLLLEESYLNPLNRPTRPDISLKLGRDEYFVLGDNRDFSSDSRVWGVLNRDFIIGRVLLRAWPLQRFGVIAE